ncbi:MAG: alpha-ketoglutarate decarboxylase [Bacteroidota bacterium]
MKPRMPLKLVVLLFCFFICSLVFSQNPVGKPKSAFWENVRFGGGIGLGFTNGGFNGSLSPSAIYQFNREFALGTSLIFNYAKFNDDKLLAYGGSLISLYNPIPAIQLSAEFEQLRINREFDNGLIQLEDNYWSPALFLGIGYTQRNVTVGIRYDVLFDEEDSIYADAWMPFVRVFF